MEPHLSVCLFVCMIKPKQQKLQWPNLPQDSPSWFHWFLAMHLILGQKSRSQGHTHKVQDIFQVIKWPAWVCTLSSGQRLIINWEVSQRVNALLMVKENYWFLCRIWYQLTHFVVKCCRKTSLLLVDFDIFLYFVWLIIISTLWFRGWWQGRTGVMICAYLLHRDHCKDADEVLKSYGDARTYNSKVGPAAGFLVRCTTLLHILLVCFAVLRMHSYHEQIKVRHCWFYW